MTLPPMILVAGSARVADCSRARQRTRSAPNTTAGGLRPGPPSAQTRDRQADFPHLHGASPRSGFVSPICNLSSAIWHLPGGLCHLASASICHPPSRAGHPPSRPLPPSVICRLASTICHTSAAICHSHIVRLSPVIPTLRRATALTQAEVSQKWKPRSRVAREANSS